MRGYVEAIEALHYEEVSNPTHEEIIGKMDQQREIPTPDRKKRLNEEEE